MDQKGAGVAPALHKKVYELQTALTQATKGIAALVVGLESSGILQAGPTDSASSVWNAVRRGVLPKGE